MKTESTFCGLLIKGDNLNRNLTFPLIHMGCIYHPRLTGADIIAKTLLGVNDTEEGFALSYIGFGGVAVAHHALY